MTERKDPILTWDGLQMNLEKGTVSYRSHLFHLTPKEYRLLEIFLTYPDRIFTRAHLLDRLWNEDEAPFEEVVTTHIKGLRQKLKAAGLREDCIETLYGMGYRLKTPPAAETEIIENIWREFKKQLPETIQLFEKALLEDNPESKKKAKALAHRTIGSAGTFGLEETARLAREIEKLSGETEPDRERVGDILKRFRASLEKEPTLSFPTEAFTGKVAKMLIVDDDRVLTSGLEKIAPHWGWTVKKADFPEEGERILQKFTPDAVLLDLEFIDRPYGLDFLRKLNKNYPELKVIILSAERDLSKRLEISRSGEYPFLQKPLSAEEIFKRTRDIIEVLPANEANITVVDDDRVILSQVRSLLEPWGFSVTTIETVEHFWEIIDRCQPDLLILDITFPDRDGLELCRTLREDSRFFRLPILILSVHDDPDTILQVYKSGADDYVRKPIVAPELLTRVYNRLERTKHCR